jgi:hypothetical protein
MCILMFIPLFLIAYLTERPEERKIPTMKHYLVVIYDHEMVKHIIRGVWESESAMLNDLMKRGYRVIEYLETKKEG